MASEEIELRSTGDLPNSVELVPLSRNTVYLVKLTVPLSEAERARIQAQLAPFDIVFVFVPHVAALSVATDTAEGYNHNAQHR